MTLQPPVAPQARVPAGPPAPVPLRPALILSVAAGLALLLALPPFDLWPLAIAGVALLAVATHRRRLRAGFGLGFLAGAVLFYPLLHWTSFAAGWLPWALLSTAEAVFFGLTGLATAWLRPLLDRYRGLLWPPLLGLLWVTQEAVRDRAPFGGFPWGRLAFSQADAPALRFAAYGGAPAVTFAVAAAAGALAGVYLLLPSWRFWQIVPGLNWRRPWREPVIALLVIAFALVILPRALPVGDESGPTKTVAIVQGNVPRLGLEFNEQRRAVLDNHVKATLALADDVKAGKQPQPDLVVWPENSSDIDPLRNQDAASEISAAADAIGAPILVGAVLRTNNPADIKNAGLLWVPGAGPDPTQQYVKRHPVPFAEYMPLRSIAKLVSDKVDLVKNMLAGTEPGVLKTGPLTLGDVICFEVAYDSIVRDTVTGGAQVLAVQTNNATFNAAEAKQQMAMVRLRAVEHGRDSLMISTVGVSGFVDVYGNVHKETGFNTKAVKVRAMHLGSSRTLATRLGVLPEIAAVALAVAALAGAFVLRRGRREKTDDGAEKAEAR
ncbi:apolipoprotein N-acyltransferase [Paractinoplanes globisporus]|uniref:Apolipoprotein N-acyltransferase n=1 Tax=Paractinoplanes globisporus TaxID=113565 RepID=A0ABW6WTW7_9ACTN|nr:apolipoprotein N-acyltransferase [Actinoplanes globisporus]